MNGLGLIVRHAQQDDALGFEGPEHDAAAAVFGAGPPQQLVTALSEGPEQTPVSGSTSSTRAAAFLSPAMSATMERTCS